MLRGGAYLPNATLATALLISMIAHAPSDCRNFCSIHRQTLMIDGAATPSSGLALSTSGIYGPSSELRLPVCMRPGVSITVFHVSVSTLRPFPVASNFATLSNRSLTRRTRTARADG
jgi:hypothetical protein